MIQFQFHEGDLLGAPDGACWFFNYRSADKREVIIKCPNNHAFALWSQGIDEDGRLYMFDADNAQRVPANFMCIVDPCEVSEQVQLMNWTHGDKEPGERFLSVPDEIRRKPLPKMNVEPVERLDPPDV